jgi:hypothetical protein
MTTQSQLFEKISKGYEEWLLKPSIVSILPSILSIPQISEIFQDKEVEIKVETDPHFKFFVRQLLYVSTGVKVRDKAGFQKLLEETRDHVSMISGKQIKCLWLGMKMDNEITSMSDDELLSIFTEQGSYHDDFLSQKAYEEIDRRRNHRNILGHKKVGTVGAGGVMR